MQQEWRHGDDEEDDEAGFLTLQQHSSESEGQLSARLAHQLKLFACKGRKDATKGVTPLRVPAGTAGWLS